MDLKTWLWIDPMILPDDVCDTAIVGCAPHLAQQALLCLCRHDGGSKGSSAVVVSQADGTVQLFSRILLNGSAPVTFDEPVSGLVVDSQPDGAALPSVVYFYHIAYARFILTDESSSITEPGLPFPSSGACGAWVGQGQDKRLLYMPGDGSPVLFQLDPANWGAVTILNGNVPFGGCGAITTSQALHRRWSSELAAHCRPALAPV